MIMRSGEAVLPASHSAELLEVSSLLFKVGMFNVFVYAGTVDVIQRYCIDQERLKKKSIVDLSPSFSRLI